jgi:long-chain acyl-CoA synthetase
MRAAGVPGSMSHMDTATYPSASTAACSAAGIPSSARQPQSPATVVAAFQASVARTPDRVALRTVGDRVSLTWAQYAAAVERAAGALAGLGVRHGDRVAFLARNSPELAICEVAAMHLGAVSVVLYVASPTATIEHVLADSTPRVMLVERELRGRLEQVRHDVPHVIAIDGPGALEGLPTPADFAFARSWQAVSPSDLLAICYTSGTTGLPKGVEWEHGPIIGTLDRFDLPHPEPDGARDICFAPFAHLGERAVGHWRSLMRGSTRTICTEPTELPAALLDTRPTFLWSSPRLWQTLKSALHATLDQDERDVLAHACARVQQLAAGGDPPALAATDERTLGVLRARIGLDRVTRAMTGAAPCPVSVQEHYHALGIPFAEFYGISELGVPTMGALGVSDLGTVGRPTPGYEVLLDADGEVLVRTDSRARGYRNRLQETAATFAADGLVHTGDIGILDEHGRLRIVDRKKELLIDEEGHNTAPAPIESALKSRCPLIGHVCLIGDGRPYLVALLVLEPVELASDPDAIAQVADAVRGLNTASDPRERIRRHTILATVWLPGEELTETLKLRRKRIREKYATHIDALYQRR